VAVIRGPARGAAAPQLKFWPPVPPMKHAKIGVDVLFLSAFVFTHVL